MTSGTMTDGVLPMAALLRKRCPLPEPWFSVLLAHSRSVAAVAGRLARREGLPRGQEVFVIEAAMVHDIGIFATRAPSLGCPGLAPYYRHGVIGAEILASEGLPAHARVCERHVGAGITREEALARGLDLPGRDLVPETLEEILVCFADKFFSKKQGNAPRMMTTGEVLASLSPFGGRQVKVFSSWLDRFGDPGLLPADVEEDA